MPAPKWIGRYNKETERVDWYEANPQPTGEVTAVVKGDRMEPFESYATGERKMFDSMSAYKAHLAEHGMEITGGDHLTGKTVENHRYKSDRGEIIESIREVRNQLKYGDFPLSEKEKERCNREQRAAGLKPRY